MEREVAAIIADKMKEAMSKIEEVIDYVQENVEFKERAPLARAIGEIFAITTDKIYPRLVKAHPELHDALFRSPPENAPDEFLRMSQLGPADPDE